MEPYKATNGMAANSVSDTFQWKIHSHGLLDTNKHLVIVQIDYHRVWNAVTAI